MSNWWHVWFSSKWLCWKKDLLPRTIRANLEHCCSRLLPSASHDSTSKEWMFYQRPHFRTLGSFTKISSICFKSSSRTVKTCCKHFVDNKCFESFFSFNVLLLCIFIAGNNPAPKPMPNNRQLQQKEESVSQQTQCRRVMPPLRSESLKNKKTVIGASSNHNLSSDSYNNKSVVKKHSYVMMPIPTAPAARCQKKSPTQIKSPNDSGPLPAQPVLLNGNRLMTGSVQMVAKWLHNNNSKQSKYLPPLFEAVEIFVGSEKVKRRVSQQCFSLRNWPKWHIEH